MVFIFTFCFLVSAQQAFPSFCAHRHEKENRNGTWVSHCLIGEKLKGPCIVTGVPDVLFMCLPSAYLMSLVREKDVY